MSIIGIIASEKLTNEIRKEMEQEGTKVELICINSKSIENIKNVKFEIIIIQESIERLKEKQREVKEILKDTKYLLLNTDVSINEDIFKDINIKILTYGLKRKATITASSIDETQVTVSIQRAFKNLRGKVIEQQEIPAKVTNCNTKNLYNSLIKISIIELLSDKNS